MSETQELSISGSNLPALKNKTFRFSSDVRETIFQIINVVKDQRKLSYWDDIPELDRNTRNTLMSFGIIMGNPDIIEHSDRNYLLIIEPEWIEDLETKVKEFVSLYLPEGEVPTHYIVNDTIETYDRFILWLRKIQEIYSDIQPLTDESSLTREASKQAGSEALIEEAISAGFEPFLLSSHLKLISEEYRRTNTRTLQMIFDLEREIVSKYRQNNKLVLMSEQFASEFSSTIASYMFYKYGISCHLGKTHTSLYLSNLTNMYSNSQYMMLEERIAFLRQLPYVSVAFDKYQQLLFFVYINKESMRCKFSVSYMDVDNPISIERAEMDISEMTVIPWSDEYDIESPDITVFRSNHDKILALFYKYYTLRKDLGPNLLTVTNTCLIELNGRKKVAYVEGIDLDLPCVYTPMNSSLPRFSKSISIDKLYTLLPINCLPGYRQAFGKNIEEVLAILDKKYPGQAKDIRKNLASFPKKTKRAVGILLQSFYAHKGSVINLSGLNDFVTIGLWWGETYIYRAGFAKSLYPQLKINETRKFSSFFSIFGGPLPYLHDTLELREEVLG